MQKIANSSWVQIIWVGVSIAQQIVQKTESCHLNIKYAGFIYIRLKCCETQKTFQVYMNVAL